MQHTLNVYKTALVELTDYHEIIKTSGINYTLPGDEFDEEETTEMKMLIDVFRSSVIAARYALSCLTALVNLWFAISQYKLTVRILSMLFIFGSEYVS
jgi:hypothetical protein